LGRSNLAAELSLDQGLTSPTYSSAPCPAATRRGDDAPGLTGINETGISRLNQAIAGLAQHWNVSTQMPIRIQIKNLTRQHLTKVPLEYREDVSCGKLKQVNLSTTDEKSSAFIIVHEMRKNAKRQTSASKAESLCT